MGHYPEDAERRRSMLELEKRLTTLEVTQKYTADQVTAMRTDVTHLVDLMTPIKETIARHESDLAFIKTWALRTAIAGSGGGILTGIGAWILRHLK